MKYKSFCVCVCVSVKKETKIVQHVLSQYIQCTSWGRSSTCVLYTEWLLVKRLWREWTGSIWFMTRNQWQATAHMVLNVLGK